LANGPGRIRLQDRTARSQWASLAARSTAPASLVGNLGLSDGHGGDRIATRTRRPTRAGVLVLSDRLDPTEIARAIDGRAAAALDKTVDLNQLVDTVRRLHRDAAAP
jgi:DNA-binding NarL/FixJ family response regulator